MRTDVRRPNVVLTVHSNGVSGNKEIVCDTAKIFPVSVKLHQRMFAAMKHEDVPLRIYRHAGDFDEMFTRGQLKEIGNRFVIELWNLLLTEAGEN